MFDNNNRGLKPDLVVHCIQIFLFLKIKLNIGHYTDRETLFMPVCCQTVSIVGTCVSSLPVVTKICQKSMVKVTDVYVNPVDFR